ncbi:hypothetical protein C8J57DRAFT_1459205 [Mycena rebaudengoi]|nr:hypothetical protein C8J57DRAFT_1459205 [Mycena rebaudengoi]
MPFSQRIFSLLSFGRAPDPPPADMRTLPCTGLDLLVPNNIITTGFIIDTRLDAKLLEQTLSTLVEFRFPRAGARLARRNGVYEFQIPRKFDTDTQPVAFSADNYPERYLSSARPELPVHVTSSPHPAVMLQPELDVYFKSRACPTLLTGFLLPNVPLVHVHVATFDDLTFIGLTSSHLTFDALGVQTLLHAWTRLLNGDPIDTIPGMDWDAEPFVQFLQPPAVTPPRGWFDLGLPSKLLLVAHLLLRIMWDPEEEARIVRLPKVFLDDAKHRIMAELKLQGSSEWVGSSDVLTAWWLKGKKTVVDGIQPPQRYDANPRSFSCGSARQTRVRWSVRLRRSIHQQRLWNDSPRTHPRQHLPHGISIRLALRIRRAILAFNADPNGIAADLYGHCSHPLKVWFPSPPRGEVTIQSNWRKARFSSLDFSGAVVGEEAQARVKLSLFGLRSTHPKRGLGLVLMEDEEAVWLSQFLGVKEWEDIRSNVVVTFI